KTLRFGGGIGAERQGWRGQCKRRDQPCQQGALHRSNSSSCGDRAASSEGHNAAQSEYSFVADALRRIVRVLDAAAGVEHVLKVRLQLPPTGGLDLVGDLDECLAATHRERTAGEE